MSPVAILGDDRVEGIELVRNVLDENERAVADRRDARRSPCGLVFRSVGYRGVELPGVPFDDRSGTIANEGGRVADGVYCAGWIKRGPTRRDRHEQEGRDRDRRAAARGRRVPAGCSRSAEATADAVDALLAERGVRVVLYAGWTAIDEAERGAGEKSGRPRVKLCTWDDLLAAAELASRAALVRGTAGTGVRGRWTYRGIARRGMSLVVAPRVYARRDVFKHLDSPECQNCGYLGWQPLPRGAPR